MSRNKRKIPANTQAERSVLGAMLISNDAVLVALEKLMPECFYEQRNQIIFIAMSEIFEESKGIDVVTLANKIKKEGNYDVVGGALYLNDLMDSIVSPANASYHCDIINDKYIQRQLIEINLDILEKAYSGNLDASEIMEETEKRVFALSELRHKKSFKHIKSYMDDTISELEDIIEQRDTKTVVKSCLSDLDNVLNGFHKGDLIILAARPSVGKTAFGLNLAMNAAIQEKKVIGIFTLEMSANDVIKRMLSAIGNINIGMLKKGYLNKQEAFENILQASETLSQSPIYIEDSAKLNTLEVRAKARRLQKEAGLDMLIIDYLQLMESANGRRNFSREQEVSHISRSLKALAKELDIPVIALAQLSRSPEQRTDKKPRLSDLRESGSIEQDADVVMFLYREDYYDKENLDIQDKIEVIIAKHRNGETGNVDLAFLKKIQKFGLKENIEVAY